MAGQFVSYAQNGEDVVLWRALGHIENGRYVDVGAMHPTEDSVTKVFYDAGWRGLNIEPVPVNAKMFASERPGDEIIEAVIAAESGRTERFYHVVNTGLSTTSESLASEYAADGREVEVLDIPTLTLADAVASSRLAGEDVHLLKVDVESSEADVIAGVDLMTWRPWVLVIEATPPNSTEAAHAAWERRVLESGYEFCLFDGLNRFYVATEHSDLAAALSVPASVADHFVAWRNQKPLLEARHQVAELRHELTQHLRASSGGDAPAEPDTSRVDALWKEVVYWRSAALDAWADTASATHQEAVELRSTLQREIATLQGEVAKVRKHSATKQERLNRRNQEVAALRRELRKARRRIRALRAERDSLQQSASWRVTRPLRDARRMIGGGA